MITELSIGEVLLYSVTGVLTVIAVLAMLAILITIVSRLVARFSSRPTPVREPLPGPDILKIEEIKDPEPPAVIGTKGEIVLRDVDDQTAAILMAIVADETGIPLNELRFKSIKCLNP